MENLNSVVSKNLIKFRTLAGLTQVELAKKINYSDKSISKWERGDGLPDLSVLVKLSEIYNININEFLNQNTPEQEVIISKKYINKKHFLISILSSGLVFFIATIVFVVLFMIQSTSHFAWLSFIYAIPISSIVLLIFSLMWGNNILNTIFSSLILWGIILSTCFTVHTSEIWILCAVGIIFEFLIIFWFIFRNKFSRHSNKQNPIKLKNSNKKDENSNKN